MSTPDFRAAQQASRELILWLNDERLDLARLRTMRDVAVIDTLASALQRNAAAVYIEGYIDRAELAVRLVLAHGRLGEELRHRS